MTLKDIPVIEPLNVSAKVDFDISDKVRARLTPVRAREKDTSRTISIYDEIGERWDGSGTTVKRIAAALRNMGPGEVVVNINSPGGDFFEGLAIYNTLREHDGGVVINVVGIAASAASVIAMAGDEIKIAKAGFLMIHNAWSIVMGNKDDMRDIADIMEKFDNVMARLYADKSGMMRAEITKLMDAETFLDGEEAVEKGLADALLDNDDVEADEEPKANMLYVVEAALKASGMSRKECRGVIKEVFSKPRAANTITPGADELEKMAALSEAIKSMNAN